MSTYHHGNLKDALRQAGAQLLEEQGVESLKLREVARRAGVSHNAPYRHYPDRESLLVEIAAEGFARLGESLRGKSGREMGEAYVGFALARPNLFRLMFGGQLSFDAHARLKAASLGTYEALLDAFRAQPNIADPEKAAAAAWSLVHGLAHLLLDGHFREQRKRGDFVGEVIAAVRFAVSQRSA